MFLWIILFIMLATIGELIYSPVLNAEEVRLIPTNQRGIYAAVSSFKFTGGDFISKLGIIIGVIKTMGNEFAYGSNFNFRININKRFFVL